MRRRCTSQRREPGSHTAPARRRMCASSAGQRTATSLPSSLSSHGPTCAGRSSACISPASIRQAPAHAPSALPGHRSHGARNSCSGTGGGSAARHRCPHRGGLAGPRCVIAGSSGRSTAGRRLARVASFWRSEGHPMGTGTFAYRGARCDRITRASASSPAGPTPVLWVVFSHPIPWRTIIRWGPLKA